MDEAAYERLLERLEAKVFGINEGVSHARQA